MLKLDSVFYRYKNSDVDVLKNVSATMTDGKVHAVIGPSGSGKTTLLSIMAGLDTPSKGSVFVDDTDIAKLNMDKYRREQIAMIFQSFHLFPVLTAIENVCYPMEDAGIPRKEARQRAAALLNSVGITDDKHKRFPSNLSGGEQQRVAIARGLSTGAKVLLADEPTGNLDKANETAIVSLLQALAHEQNYCVVVVTHNLEIAEASDVVLRMSHGELAGVFTDKMAMG